MHHWDHFESHIWNLLDKIKTLGFFVITFFLFMLETLVLDFFSLVCFLFQLHLCIYPNKVRTIIISVISNLILVGRYSYFYCIT